MAYCGKACALSDWGYHSVAEHSEWHSRPLDLILEGGTADARGDLWVGGAESIAYLDNPKSVVAAAVNRSIPAGIGALERDRPIPYVIGAVVTILQYGRIDETLLVQRVGARPHLRFLMHDAQDEPISNAFKASRRFIRRHLRAGRHVLVHCHGGVSRSVTLCVEYMMRYRAFTLEGALEHIRKVRPYVEPNPGFMRALEESEREVLKSKA